MTTEPRLVPCRFCGALTPIETICHVQDEARTCCPMHREVMNDLAAAVIAVLVRKARSVPIAA